MAKTKKRSRRPSQGFSLGIMQESLASISSEITVLKDRLQHLHKEMDNMRDVVKSLDEASGGTWRQKNGTLIMIRSMSNNHLLNALAMMSRNGQRTMPLFAKLEAEMERRKNDALLANPYGSSIHAALDILGF